MIRAFVVDDESFSIQRLAVMLSRFGDVETVGSKSIPSKALDRITSAGADVIFLDIEMPGLNGLELARKVIERSPAPPCIVFVTAYTQFAVGAFETGAIDFLVKPVQQKRLASALDRVRGALESRFARDRLFEILGQLDRLRDDRSRTTQEHQYLWINQRGKIVKLDLNSGGPNISRGRVCPDHPAGFDLSLSGVAGRPRRPAGRAGLCARPPLAHNQRAPRRFGRPGRKQPADFAGRRLGGPGRTQLSQHRSQPASRHAPSISRSTAKHCRSVAAVTPIGEIERFATLPAASARIPISYARPVIDGVVAVGPSEHRESVVIQLAAARAIRRLPRAQVITADPNTDRCPQAIAPLRPGMY